MMTDTELDWPAYHELNSENISPLVKDDSCMAWLGKVMRKIDRRGVKRLVANYSRWFKSTFSIPHAY
jgi:hypothetical protein